METKIQSNEKNEVPRQKNVLYLITKSNFGGAQKYVYELAVEAKKRGFGVAVAVGGNGILINKLEAADIKLYKLESLKRDIGFFDEIKSFFEIIKILRTFKPDFFHVNSSKAGGIGALAGRICGVPKIIFTIHGWAFNEERSALSKLLIKVLYLVTIFLSHVSIAVSENTKNQATQILCYFLIKNKIIVIRNGIQEINFLERSSARNFFKEKFSIGENETVIVTLAELHPVKGLKYLVGATKKFFDEHFAKGTAANVKFLIFGTGDQKNELEKMIDDLCLKNKVILGGFLDNASTYLKGCDIFMFSSISEAMPLSIIEAGLAELPIISTNVGGISEIIENDVSGILIESKNEEQIVRALNFLLNDHNKAKQMALNLKHKIDREFNLETFYKKTFDIYKTKQ